MAQAVGRSYFAVAAAAVDNPVDPENTRRGTK